MKCMNSTVIARGALVRTSYKAFRPFVLCVALSMSGTALLADDAQVDSTHRSNAVDNRQEKPAAGKPKTLGALPSAIPLKPSGPQFGFRSKFVSKDGIFGEQVSEVQLGSPAERMKLLPGDIILSVNGTKLTTPISWHVAMERIAMRDGWVTLKVRCRETGVIAYRTTNLLHRRDR